MRYRLQVVALALLAVLLVPSAAYAEDLGGSFVSGLETTLTGKAGNELVEPEREFNESYVPNQEPVKAAPVVEETTPYGSITAWITSLRLTYGTATFGPDGWYRMARSLLQNVVLPVAVLLVFMWWGVRKAIRILFAAFRKGKANV